MRVNFFFLDIVLQKRFSFFCWKWWSFFLCEFGRYVYVAGKTSEQVHPRNPTTKNPTNYKIQKSKNSIIKQSKPVQINNKYKFLCFKPNVVNLITTSDRSCLEYPQLWSHGKKKDKNSVFLLNLHKNSFAIVYFEWSSWTSNFTRASHSEIF